MNESNSNATQGRVKVSRPTYDEAFKRSAVEHYQRHGGTIQRTAQELGINYWTLRGWIQSQGAPQGLPAIRNLSEAETEITRLRAELARVTEQRDVLKWMLEVNSSWAALLSAGMNPVQSGIRPPSPALNPGR